MPRLDWQMWFAALGNYRQSRWFLPFCARLLQGSPTVIGLMQSNPFPDRPPRYLRAVIADYHFTSTGERARSGRWWRSDAATIYLPAVELSADGRLRQANLN
jgi:hypothetical protein